MNVFENTVNAFEDDELNMCIYLPCHASESSDIHISALNNL